MSLRWVCLPLLLSACSVAPEILAVRYLAREVPEWPLKNQCFSCHNNGDAARALYAARAAGIAVDPAALETTARWLRRPEGWKDNGPKVEYSDQKLATLQFAHALLSVPDARAELAVAARQVRALQEPDGSWAVDEGGLPGSPVTYGRALATLTARRILQAAGEDVAAADRWLRQLKPAGVLDAAVLLQVSGRDPADCLEILRKGQSRDGGWGPYRTSPPEPFDTAMALLGLAAVGERDLLRRGRAFLIATQLPDGSWPETTRPAGATSYAQRISTSGWATLALLATRE